MDSVFEKTRKQLEQKLPFVLYNKPDAAQLIGMYQRDDELFLVKDYKEIGFILAPFDGDKIVLIPAEHSDIIVCDFVPSIIKNKSAPETSDKIAAKEFESLVQKGIDAIVQGQFSKVVLSRKEIVDLPDFNFIEILQTLFQTYPTAFTYCFYHPKVGLWLGAFSEQLIKKQRNTIHTMAVAGTQRSIENENVIWGNKEQEEQQMVSDFIVQKLAACTSDIIVSLPYTLNAGNVIHIKTDIEAEINADSNLKGLIAVLHPTPAVCGLPKDKALDFILENENYDREYYSGFLGELNRDFVSGEDNTDLFVNLRCMKIENSKNRIAQAHLYIGCGITKDSVPAKEWEETVNKSMTIRKILN